MLNIFRKETPATTVPKSNIQNLIHDGSDYFSDELICLDEKLSGNLFCAENVVIEQHGELIGNITSKTCLVTGIVNGNITSLDLLDIKSSAVVRGNIQSGTVNIEPGAVINGYITVGEDIEALTAQWNKTKFSSDDYLTLKLKREIAALNNISSPSSNNGPGKIEPCLVSAVILQTAATPPEPLNTVLSKPLVAATPFQQEQSSQQSFTAKPLIAAASLQDNQQDPNTTPAQAPKPLVAAAPQPQSREQENSSRWW